MELLTVDEVAELLRISRNKVVMLARRGELPAVRIAGKLRFDADEIERWVKANQIKLDA